MENNNKNIKSEFEKHFERYIIDLYKEYLLWYLEFRKNSNVNFEDIRRDIYSKRGEFYLFLRNNFIIKYFDYLDSLNEEYFSNIIDKNFDKIKSEIENIDNKIFEDGKEVVKRVVTGLIIPQKIYMKNL